MENPVGDLVRELENLLAADELTRMVRSLHEAYNGLMADWEVWKLMVDVLPTDLRPKLEVLRPTVVGHRILNEVLMRYYPGERVLKYHLASRYLNRPDEVSLFEMPVGGSRLDFGRINGESFAYEIKTELDTVDRLEKQIADYSSVFEYVTVLAHESHVKIAMDSLPDHCGLVAFTVVEGTVYMNEVRPTHKSPAIDVEKQIRCLSSRDISFVLKELGVTPVPRLRSEKEASLRSVWTSDGHIGELFKLALKNKFRRRWSYLQSVFGQVQPIDIELFYSACIDPEWVYYKNSSMV